MPTEITRPSAPIIKRVGMPGPSSRDVKPLNLTALAIIAALVVIIHVAAGALLDHSHAHASIAAADDEALCLGDAKPAVPSLPFD
jgi:hypothetical protein